MTEHEHLRCQARIWQRGEDRICGQSVAIRTWQDGSGRTHAACPHHIGAMRRRNPPGDWHGRLLTGSPWTRAKFAPPDRALIEANIPADCLLEVAAFRTRHRFVVTAWRQPPEQDASRVLLQRSRVTDDPLAVAWALIRELWGGVLDEAKRVESWTLAPDGSVTTPLDYTRTEA